MNGETLIALAAGSIVSLAVTGIFAMVSRYLKRRVTVASPEARKLDQMIPAVNALVRVAAPQNEALIAILEAQKGVCNGNVDRVLDRMRETRDEFNQFLVSSALVDKEAS